MNNHLTDVKTKHP